MRVTTWNAAGLDTRRARPSLSEPWRGCGITASDYLRCFLRRLAMGPKLFIAYHPSFLATDNARPRNFNKIDVALPHLLFALFAPVGRWSEGKHLRIHPFLARLRQGLYFT
jgi:hypothetical protein